MENNYNFKHKCPSPNHYELYLQGEGTEVFKNDFENHLKECNLCNEAIEGYKITDVYNVNASLKAAKLNVHKTKVPKHLKIFRYAASVIILLGITAIFLGRQNTNHITETVSISDYSIFNSQEITGQKKLTTKSTEQYIYINSCNQIAYNDQIISAQELSLNLKKQSNVSMLRIEINVENQGCVSQIINEIKTNCSVPVLTISNAGGIKKLTS